MIVARRHGGIFFQPPPPPSLKLVKSKNGCLPRRMTRNRQPDSGRATMASVVEVADAKEENCHLKFEFEEDEPKTDWPSVRIICVILFLGAIQMFVIGMSEWPYMKQVDPEATSTFFGYVGSVSALGHAICAPLVGYWSSATGQTKWPLITGRIVAMVGCVIYICLELFPSNRRYIMLLCYTLFGISMSTVSVMRGYVAKISTVADRASAISLFGLANMLAVSIGPLFQLFFTPLKYPGLDVIPGGHLRLNIYTGPIYVATVANILSLIIIIFFFKDKTSVSRAPKRDGLQRRPSKARSALTTDMRSFSMPLALTCIFSKMAATLVFVTIHTTTAPLMMTVFHWSNEHTVKVSSFVQATVGVCSLIIFAGFATGKLTKLISERLAALLSLILFTLFVILTYPWPFAGKTIEIQNASNNMTGCDPNIYSWCLTDIAVNPIVYLVSMVTVLGIAVTLATISIDTLYSKILGKIDQGTMQGVFLFALDIINVCGPLVIAPLFTASGQKYIWLIDGCVLVSAIILYSFQYKKLPKAKKA